MPIIIMPILPLQITPNLIELLRILENLHIHIHDRHALGTASEAGERADERHRDLGEAGVAFSWGAAGVGEYDGCE